MTDRPSSWRQSLEPVISPLFRQWWRLRRGMTLGVRGLATDAAGRVLLVRHTYIAGWFLPGGGVESGETAPEAVAREMAEEGGIEIVGAPALVGFYANGPIFPNDHVVLYRVDTWRACATASAGEIAERGFFARDALPDGVTAGTRARLAEVFDGVPPSPFWTGS
jgi:8-oxo-dGTP pyrophosphatase MutT (NUDIX family)